MYPSSVSHYTLRKKGSRRDPFVLYYRTLRRTFKGSMDTTGNLIWIYINSTLEPLKGSLSSWNP